MVVFGRERNALREKEMRSRKRTRGKGCNSIQEIVKQIERNFLAGELTPTATELVRLLDLQRGQSDGGKRHFEVRWVRVWQAADRET